MKEEFKVIEYPLSKADDRGWVIRPIYNQENDFVEIDNDEGLGDIYNLHVVSIEPDVIRGNHFHEKQIEFLVVMGGLVEIVWQYPNEEKKYSKSVNTEKPIVLRVPKNVIHSLKNTGDKTLYVICYSKAHNVSGKDSVKVKDFHK